MFLLFFSSSLLLLYNFFLIRHIYKINAETKRLLSCDRKLFLLYVVNSRLKKFFCCLLQGIILSSQITIYTSHCTFLLLQYVNDLCRRSEYLRIDSFVSLREHPLAKIFTQSLKSSLPYQALPSNRTAKVIPFYYTTKLFTNFFRKKEKFIANTLNKRLFKKQIIFEFFQILIGKIANLAEIVYTF